MMFLQGLIEFGHVSEILKRYLLSLLSKLVILTALDTEPLCFYIFSFPTSTFEIV
jgi:hypothetical protein